MSAKFLEGVGSKLAEQWITNLLTPAFVFWGGGLLAYISRYGWQPIAQFFPDAKLEALQIGIISGAFVLIYLSALMVQRFDSEVLRGLEGYWYPGLRTVMSPLLKHLTQCQINRRQNLLKRWKPLNRALKNQQSLSRDERTEFVRCDRAFRHFPSLSRSKNCLGKE
jgi:hypothetical protein